MEDKKVCDDVCLCRCEWSFHLLHGHGTPLERGFMAGLLSVFFLGAHPPLRGKVWRLHFSEVDVFSQIREALRKLFSASVVSQMFSA